MILTPQLAFLLIIAAVVVGSLVLYAVFALASKAVVADGPTDDDVSLVERARAIRPPRSFLGRIDRRFEDTVRGTLFDLTTERAVEVVLISAGLGGLIAYLFSDSLFLLAFGVLVGAFLAAATFVVFSHRRRRAIQDQLPDGCFQLARCLRAGLGIRSAVAEAAEYTPTPLSGVLTGIGKKLEMGQHPGEAFASAAADVKLTDFDLLAAVMDLHAEVGGNLPQMLDQLAAAVRDRNQFRGYVKSVTSLSRISTIFLAAAAPVAFVLYLIFEPEPGLFARFFTSGLGLSLLAAAVVLEIVGIVWSFWLLRRAEDY